MRCEPTLSQACAMHSASLATSLITITKEVAKARLACQAGCDVFSLVWAEGGNQIEDYSKATDSIRRLGLCRRPSSPAGRLTRADASIVHSEAPFADLSTHFRARGHRHGPADEATTRANIGRKVSRCVAFCACTWNLSPASSFFVGVSQE